MDVRLDPYCARCTPILTNAMLSSSQLCGFVDIPLALGFSRASAARRQSFLFDQRICRPAPLTRHTSPHPVSLLTTRGTAQRPIRVSFCAALPPVISTPRPDSQNRGHTDNFQRARSAHQSRKAKEMHLGRTQLWLGRGLCDRAEGNRRGKGLGRLWTGRTGRDQSRGSDRCERSSVLPRLS